MSKTRDSSERRKFIRLDSIFPVEFCFINKENQSLGEWMQGYTNNFSRGGIRLEAHNISAQTLFLLQSPGVTLKIIITVPFSNKKTEAEAAIRWFQESSSEKGAYLIGVEYEKIDAAALGALMRYVYKKKIIFPFVLGLMISVGLLALLLSVRQMQLSKDKTELQRKATEISQQLHAVKEQFQQTLKERKELEKTLVALRKEFDSAKEKKSEMAKIIAVQEEWMKKMDMTLRELQDEKNDLATQLSALQEAIAEGADVDNQVLEKKIEALHQRLKSQQDPESGFIVGSTPLLSKGTGGAVFLSDQADALQTFVLFSEFKEADKLLEAIEGKLERKRGLFYDGYSMPSGKSLVDHPNSLSNMYLGIAIMQYTHSSGDSKYFTLVESIAEELMSWQKKDSQGVIPFLEKEPNTFLQLNLIAYAFFDLLYSITEDLKYGAVRDKISEYVFSTLSEEIKRPFGELAFLTIGPETLNAGGIDPLTAENLIESNAFVQEHLTNSDGEERIFSGIRFNFKEGPEEQPISSYRTAQMALICEILREYCVDKQMQERAENYKNRRLLYLKTLSGMIIMRTDDSGKQLGYLPDFFSADFYLKEAEGLDVSSLSSISASAYTIFAHYSYNPFDLMAKSGIKSD